MTRKVGFSAMLGKGTVEEMRKLLKCLPNAEESKNKPKDLDLRIIAPYEMKTTTKFHCKSTTPLGLKQMIEESIDPFEWNFAGFAINNLFLTNKRIAFLGPIKQSESIQKYILEMNGTICDDNADYFIAEKKIKKPFKEAIIVSTNWITTLYTETHYVEPLDFTFESIQKNTHKPKKDLGKSMKNPRQKMKQIADGNPKALQEAEHVQPITNFFGQTSQTPKKEEKEILDFDSKIPLPSQDIFSIPPNDECETIKVEESPPVVGGDSSQPQKPKKTIILCSSSSDDEDVINDVDETLKKYAIDKDLEEYISSQITNKSEHSSQHSKFEYSSDDDDIEILSSDKITLHNRTTGKASSTSTKQFTPKREATCLPHPQFRSDNSPDAPSYDDSHFCFERERLTPILPSPVQKPKGRSQMSPIIKHMNDNDDNDTCAMLCRKIMETKIIPAAPRSPSRKRLTMEDIIQFTQESQQSQRDEGEIDYLCENSDFHQTFDFSQNSDPLLMQLRE